jgi:hypothetical protein
MLATTIHGWLRGRSGPLHYNTARQTSETLVPPNAKEFDMAAVSGNRARRSSDVIEIRIPDRDARDAALAEARTFQ